MIVGIDPGMTGAITLMHDGLEVFDMPIFEITKGKSKRKHININGLHAILAQHKIDHAFIEKVSAQPGNGAAAAFTYGFGCGAIEAVVTCCGIPFTYVTPQKWKKDTKTPKDKDGARYRASQLMPDYSDFWPLKKHDGRAEASLIALWGRDYG